MHQNVQCIRNKVNQIELILDETQTDILCVTEHWLKCEELSSINLTGYDKANFYCRTTYIHGGVGIFIKKGMKYQKIETNSIEKDFESVAIKCSLSNISLVVLATYRSPNGVLKTFIGELYDTITNISNKYPKCKIILCGDFNINFLTKSNSLMSLLDVLESLALPPTIKTCTRGKNCLDNMCTNLDKNIYETGNIETHISDHEKAQFLKLKMTTYDANEKIIYYYRDLHDHSNLSNFKYLISKEKWSEIYRLEVNINEKFAIFTNTLNHYFDICFPRKRKIIDPNIKKRKPWLTQGLLISGQNMKHLYNLTLNGDKETTDYYNTYKKIYRTLLNKAKKLYNSNLIMNSNNKTKTAWNIIRQEVHQKNESKKLELIVDNNLITEPQSISNKFNEYFNNIPYSINSNSLQALENTLTTNHSHTFYFIPATKYDILDIINNLKNNNSTDFTINVRILKTIKDYIAQPLTYLINESQIGRAHV